MEISQQEALDCFASDDLIGIGMEADAVRRTLHPDNLVTYSVPCTFALDQPLEELLAQVEEAARAGNTTVCLAHNAAAGLSISALEATIAAIRNRFPSLRIHALSTGGILGLAEIPDRDPEQTLARLKAAGLDSISGDDLCAVTGASGLIPARLVGLDQWLEVHRMAHSAGIHSTAGLVFGLGESPEDRVRALFAIRALQAETNGFTAFTLLSMGTLPRLEQPTAVEYLRTLAVARIVLDNIPSVESRCVAHGLKVVQMALRFGANDAGALSAEEIALRKAGFTEEDLRRVIRDAGFTPVERDPLYRALFLNN
jgi:cyclic dehypoxanthinyl futalosine synthase